MKNILYITIIIFLSSCAFQKNIKIIGDYSDNSKESLNQLINIIDVADNEYYETQIEKLIPEYSSNKNINYIRFILDHDEIKGRKKIITILQEYIESLHYIVVNNENAFTNKMRLLGSKMKQIDSKKLNKIFDKTITFVNKQQANNKNNAIFKEARTIAQGSKVAVDILDKLNPVVNALIKIGSLVGEKQKIKSLNKLIKKMNSSIVHICNLIIADIGVSPNDKNPNTQSLRELYWSSSQKVIDDINKFIIIDKSLTFFEKASQIRLLSNTIYNREKIDYMFEKSRDAIILIRNAHIKLDNKLNKQIKENQLQELIIEIGDSTNKIKHAMSLVR